MCVCVFAEARGEKDDSTLESLGIKDGGVLYFKDLGNAHASSIVCLIILFCSVWQAHRSAGLL